MRIPLLPVVLLLTLGMPARLLSWTPPERVDRKPENYVVYISSIAAEPDHGVHIVWSECKRETYYEKIMYARRQDDTWTIPVNISRDSGDIRTPAVALDSTGRALVVWSEEGRARMRYVRQLGDTWSMPKFCFPNNGITPRLAVDSTGRVHLLYEEIGGQDAIWYSRYVPGEDTWETPTLVADDSGVLGWSDLAVDGQDRLHAVWMNYGTNGIDYSRNDGSGWSAPVALPDPSPEGQSCDPRIACDTSGRPHVVWEERSGGYFVFHSRLLGDTWTAPYQVDGESGLRPVVACDAFGRTHVIWRNTGLWHASRCDTGWSDKEVVTDSTSAGSPGLAWADSALHLVWRHDWGVYYCRQDGPGGVAEEPSYAQPLDSIVISTTGRSLKFQVRDAGPASLSLWDSSGRRALDRDLGYLTPGVHEVGLPLQLVPAGRYVCRLTVGSKETTSAVVVVR